MGMFDYVNVKLNCPECGKEITNFQSKDSLCTMDKIDPQNVNEFHALCDCGHFISFARIPIIKREKPRNYPYNLGEIQCLGFHLVE